MQPSERFRRLQLKMKTVGSPKLGSMLPLKLEPKKEAPLPANIGFYSTWTYLRRLENRCDSLDISLHLCDGAYGIGGSRHCVMAALPSAGGPWLFAVQQQLAKKLRASIRMAGAFAG